jgi:hypothetical protein
MDDAHRIGLWKIASLGRQMRFEFDDNADDLPLQPGRKRIQVPTFIAKHFFK